jgi:hypothetical protein
MQNAYIFDKLFKQFFPSKIHFTGDESGKKSENEFNEVNRQCKQHHWTHGLILMSLC